MPRQHPVLVLRDFNTSVQQSLNLAAAARQWISPAQGPRHPKFTMAHQAMLMELAYLKSFLAWESFLEESFVLYLWGKKTPRRYAPKRYVIPTTREYAIALTLPEGRHYTDWDNPEVVLNRARRFFVNGEPYENVLRTHINLFQSLQVIRNAIVHRSTSSQARFEFLVRNELGAFPSSLSVGRFLGMAQPSSSPPVSFLEHYLTQILGSAQQIVPV